MKFFNRLKQLRSELNISAIELAEKLNKSESTIRMWEVDKSKPDVDKLIELSRIFNVSTDYLLGLSDYKNEQNADIGKITGLNDSAVNELQDNNHCYNEAINALISHKDFKEMLVTLSIYLSPDASKDFGNNMVSELKKNNSFYADLKDVSFDYDTILLSQVTNIAQKIFYDIKTISKT